MAMRCFTCGGSGQVDVENGRITFGGSADGMSVPCPSCRGSGTKGGPIGTTGSVDLEGGCVSRFVGWVFGWIILGVLAFAAFAALVFIPRLFTNNDGKAVVGLVAAETGMGFAANYKVGDCHRAGSTVAVPCDGPHASQVYAVVYVSAAPGTPYPAPSNLRTFGRSRCEPQFATYAAGSPKDLGVSLGVKYPNAAEWAGGVRQILCGAIALRGTTLSAPLPRA